jgi:hypothetical protein
VVALTTRVRRETNLDVMGVIALIPKLPHRAAQKSQRWSLPPPAGSTPPGSTP